MVYEAEKTIRENEDKIPEDVKTEVQTKMQAVRDAMQGDAATLRQAMDDFNTSLAKVGQHIYQQAGSTSGGSGQSGSQGDEGAAKDDDDVVDADYREVQ
jgi:molecular chaperone DnaK